MNQQLNQINKGGRREPPSYFYPGPDAARDRQAASMDKKLRQFITKAQHPCLGAQAAFNTEQYRFGLYPRLSDTTASQNLAQGLSFFLHETASVEGDFLTFMAVFEPEVSPVDERTFERHLWKQLQQLHLLDTSEWSRESSPDPQDPSFGFSFGGVAWYVVGMHPGSARLSRQFGQPMMVFNLRRQFEKLKETGKYQRLKQKIRQRDRELQGHVNPVLSDFGKVSEAAQYSGRQVDPRQWKCPFHQREDE